MPTQLLIDGHSLLFRAYHALPPLQTKNGVPTGAMHGFLSMLFRVTEAEKPERLIVVFDAAVATFRHEQFAEYKAQRDETPDDFRQQLPLLRELLERLGVPVLAVGGFEADDTLGTLAYMGRERGYHSLIVTGDRDLLQLVDDQVTVLLTSRTGISDLDRMTRDKVKEKMGVWPEQVPDLKGLMGDGSDNIPGVAGIGQKSALALIDAYQSVDNLLEHLHEVSNARWLKALQGHEEEARRFRDLATIVTKVPLEWPDVSEPFLWHVDAGVAAMLDELELHQVKKRLKISDDAGKAAQASIDDGAPLPPVEVLDAAQFPLDSDTLYGCLVEGANLWIYNPHTHQAARLTPDDYPLPPVKLAGWGIKAVFRDRFEKGRPLPEFREDVKLQAYLLDTERRDYGIAGLLKEAGIQTPEANSGQSAAAVSLLAERLGESLQIHGLGDVYRQLEMPLARVLARMEAVGVQVDRDRLASLGEELKESIVATEQEIYHLAGLEFNINSQRQLGEVLFDKLGLPAVKRTKTGFSTDAETLETLSPLHPVVDKVLTYRQLVKIESTYVEGLLPLIQSDGRIHTTFHQTVTATGRLSSSDPNLQNIPVRLPLGRRVRSVFVASPGRTLLAADYSQIELRMLAHLAGDENLIQAFQDGEDIHRRTASEIFNIPLDEVDSTWRSRAKAVNFGIIYGISDFGLSRDTGVSRSEAKDYIDRYYRRYPRLKEYFEGVIEGARRDGFVTTIMGRRRLLPEIRSKNRARRQYAERMAMNTAIQGSAADLIKKAMLAIDAHLTDEGLKSDMILQVHDELIWDAERDELEQLRSLAVRDMAGAMSLKVPLVVEVKSGDNWDAMNPWPEDGTHA
ncbi:DNA polymerase I [Sulfobacillus harzensis]|uniref:DNA polymerase I n=1 Tax=Sulfobacillus harzensis TaxID=2729629 RepID=A0A7Y0L416_9FIRM|nr:DNA polymerase I [Sulfobacillus harzensis]NMP22840.1 DNA polymerase I [Sulfobacillus harzensis]